MTVGIEGVDSRLGEFSADILKSVSLQRYSKVSERRAWDGDNLSAN
jgi:hypothetical protein